MKINIVKIDVYLNRNRIKHYQDISSYIQIETNLKYKKINRIDILDYIRKIAQMYKRKLNQIKQN